MKKTLLLLFAFFIVSCKNGQIEKDNMIEIKNMIESSNIWFKQTKDRWQNRPLKNMPKNYIHDSIQIWIDESDFFSKAFVDGIMQMEKKNRYFGLYFFSEQGLGQTLKAFCHEDGNIVLQEIDKISKDRYRYTTNFYYVLNSLPDINEDGAWQMYRGENGEIFQFSIIIIKENDKWVIDKFEMIEAVDKDIYN